MEININNMNKNIEQIDKKINEYELEFINFFANLNNCSTYWDDNIAKSFFIEMETQKNNYTNTIKIIREKVNTYKYIVDKYSHIGNEIKCQYTKKDTIITKINNNKNIVNNIINLYNNLNLSFCLDIRYKMNNQKQQFNQLFDDFESLKNEISELFDQIKNIEEETNHKFNNDLNFNIEKFDFIRYKGNENGKN